MSGKAVVKAPRSSKVPYNLIIHKDKAIETLSSSEPPRALDLTQTAKNEQVQQPSDFFPSGKLEEQTGSRSIYKEKSPIRKQRFVKEDYKIIQRGALRSPKGRKKHTPTSVASFVHHEEAISHIFPTPDQDTIGGPLGANNHARFGKPAHFTAAGCASHERNDGNDYVDKKSTQQIYRGTKCEEGGVMKSNRAHGAYLAAAPVSDQSDPQSCSQSVGSGAPIYHSGVGQLLEGADSIKLPQSISNYRLSYSCRGNCNESENNVDCGTRTVAAVAMSELWRTTGGPLPPAITCTAAGAC